MSEVSPRDIGGFVLLAAFVIVIGMLVIGGPVIAMIMARASFKDPGKGLPSNTGS